jgi:hypothetical protein
MNARNKNGIERFFTRYTKKVMAHNYISRRDAQTLTQEWDDNQIGIGAMTDNPREYNFQTDRCLGEYVGYTGRSLQL